MTITLLEVSHEVSLIVDLAVHCHPLRAVTDLLVHHGFVTADLVRRVSRSAAHRTPYLKLEPDEQELIGIFVEIGWCRDVRGETKLESGSDA